MLKIHRMQRALGGHLHMREVGREHIQQLPIRGRYALLHLHELPQGQAARIAQASNEVALLRHEPRQLRQQRRGAHVGRQIRHQHGVEAARLQILIDVGAVAQRWATVGPLRGLHRRHVGITGHHHAGATLQEEARALATR
jgi:hypothetical protein